MREKKLSKEENDENDERWLFTDWGFALSSFKIYDSFKTFNLITERKINSDGFNIDDIEREIVSYAKINNINIKGLQGTLHDIHSEGYSYTDKTKNNK